MQSYFASGGPARSRTLRVKKWAHLYNILGVARVPPAATSGRRWTHHTHTDELTLLSFQTLSVHMHHMSYVICHIMYHASPFIFCFSSALKLQ